MRYTSWAWALTIVAIALLVRTYDLSVVPYGLHVDEIKAGWNAVSIMETGRDDKGNWLPLYYDSFGDFRPAGLVYAIIPFIAMIGRTIAAIRMPFAVFGALSVIPLMLFVREISKTENKNSAWWAGLLLALNPWHIILSRATSEGIVAMFLALWGLLFFVKLLKTPKFWIGAAAAASFIGGYFFYHNIRVLAPAFTLAIVFMGWHLYRKEWKFKFPLTVSAVIIAAAAIMLLDKNGLARMNQVGIKSDFRVLYEVTKMPNEEGPNKVFIARAFHNRIVSYGRVLLDEYKNYFSTNFWLGDLGKPVRYKVPQVGLLTYVEVAMLIVGIMIVLKRRELQIVLLLLLIAPLPAAVTIEDTPNIVRAMFMVPFISIMAAYGISFLKIKGVPDIFGKAVVLTGLVLNFIYFWHMYLSHQNQSLAIYFRDGGGVELVNELMTIKSAYKEVVLTNYPDDLYPWVAYLGDYNTKSFNSSYRPDIKVREFENLLFSQDKCPSIKAMEEKREDRTGVLFVDAEGCAPSPDMKSMYDITEVNVIHRPDGSPPYIMRTILRKPALQGGSGTN